MKKILVAVLLAVTCFASQAFARDDAKVRGIVLSVDLAQNSFEVDGFDGSKYRFFTNEGTEMEKDYDFWFDSTITLSQLKTGDRVKVEYYDSNPDKLIAKEVNVK